jgi:hypothetical protein
MDSQHSINVSPRIQYETELPLLFTARMLVFFLLWIMGLDTISPPFLPFIASIDSLRDFPSLFKFLDWVYWISMVMVFVGIRFRAFSLIIGCLLFSSILASKLQFSNSLLYAGCFFFLIGLYKPGLEWIFKVQIALLYLGAGLNKLLDPDWISGQYFDFFITQLYPNQLILYFSSEVPGLLFAKIASFFTIITELTLGIWALIGKRRLLLGYLIHGFHLLMLIVTSGTLSYIFYFLMAVSSYLVLPWSEDKGTVIHYPVNCKVIHLLKLTDRAQFFSYTPLPKENFEFFTFQKLKDKEFLNKIN